MALFAIEWLARRVFDWSVEPGNDTGAAEFVESCMDAIGIERDLAGIPVATPPDGVDLNLPQHADLLADVQTMVTSIRRPQDGWKLELMSAAGSRQIDTDKIIRRYEQRIATSMLADFILVGPPDTSSRARSRRARPHPSSPTPPPPPPAPWRSTRT